SIESTKEVASSIERIVIVEVMGRDSGDIALWSGVCSDVNYIIIPEANYNVQNIIDQILNQRKNGETYSIIIVSEGASTGEEIKNIMENRMKEKIRVLVLGYLQRGSAPTAYDRMIASKMGVEAIKSLMKEERSYFLSLSNNNIKKESLTLQNRGSTSEAVIRGKVEFI